MSVLTQIDRYLRVSNMSATRLGREVANDPRLVPDMRRGRQLRPETQRRVLDYIRARMGDAL